MYINRMIRQYYHETSEISRKPIYMDGKMKYKDNAVIRKIEDQTRKYAKTGDTSVFYCIDTDDWDRNPDHQRELIEIEKYCKENGHELIWFCRDIEQVFWGEQVSDSEKRARAEQYLRQNRINEMDFNELQVEDKRVKCSNILLILDKYMERT